MKSHRRASGAQRGAITEAADAGVDESGLIETIEIDLPPDPGDRGLNVTDRQPGPGGEAGRRPR